MISKISREPIQQMLDQAAFDETRKLLVDLAINLSQKTRLQAVPPGTRSWVYEEFNDVSSLPTTHITIQLIPFFGMYVGYNSRLDILVCWEQ